MTFELTLTIAAIAGVVGALAFGVYWWMNRTPHVARDESGVLPLFGLDDYTTGEPDVGIMEGGAVRLQAPYVTPTTSAPPVAGRRSPRPSAASPGMPPSPAPHTSPPTPTRQQTSSAAETPSSLPEPGRDSVRPPRESSQEPENVPPAITVPGRKSGPTIREFVTGGTAASPPATPAPEVVSNTGVPGTMVEGHLLRFSVPAEGTLQFLPGRLEIASGMDAGREIRFVHVPGPNGMEVTFGRSEGELYRHIQLRDQTVSRSHAKLRLDDGQWMLTNFSRTNPVVCNGEVVDDDGERALEDGDRIEMGEVLFTFRSR